MGRNSPVVSLRGRSVSDERRSDRAVPRWAGGARNEVAIRSRPTGIYRKARHRIPRPNDGADGVLAAPDRHHVGGRRFRTFASASTSRRRVARPRTIAGSTERLATALTGVWISPLPIAPDATGCRFLDQRHGRTDRPNMWRTSGSNGRRSGACHWILKAGRWPAPRMQVSRFRDR